ncbi:putative DNA repair protein RAD50 [Amylocarpus encephaloides]|uniref:DNA repair protein RAD50 n=1 Tax=Amylocarpus encephaloides TaxID=45428 RepID=A0A9P7YLY1_9HELO|nr:putative DNA repair protein RAD50 [Amylocarpus encephaloides]
MSQIEKLKIQGVRSFDNSRSEVIYFHAPLTLIVGYNGSGKTTIIECLKYAATGQQPPNSKGGAFVHEPKLSGEKEVLAQVKLQFKDSKGSKLVITRSLQLTVKKATRASKTLDCNLMMIRDGERTNLSKRVAEMDAIIPKYLGVSNAILETVIFCHQDESLWPMSEPLVLKKKFDEIFEALKYTKAIDNLKSLRKGRGDELKTLRIHEGNFKINKDKAEKCEKKSLALQNEMEVIRQQIFQLDKDLKAANNDKAEKESRAAKANTVVEELKNKTTQAKYLENNVNELKAHIKEFQESDEWLEDTLAQYDERMAQYEEQNIGFQTQYTELNASAKSAGRTLAKKQAERGQHQADKATFEQNLETRRRLVSEAAVHHSMRGYEGDLDDEQIQEFVERIEKLSREKDRDLEKIRKQTDGELQKKQTVLTNLELTRTTRTQEKVNAKQTIANNDKKISAKQMGLRTIRMDEGTLAALKKSLKDVQENLQRLNADYEAASWDANMKHERSQLRELQDEATRLRNELVQSNRLVEGQAALQLVKKEAKDREARLETIKATYSNQLVAVVGNNWQFDNLEHDYQVAMEERNQAVESAKKQQDGLNRELTGLEFRLKTVKDSFKQKKTEMQKCKDLVMDSIFTVDGSPISSVDDYPKELAELETFHNENQKSLDGADYVLDYYRKGQENIQRKNCCKLCERPFGNGQEKSAALDKLNQLIAKTAKKEFEKALSESGEDIKTANAARMHYETYKTLSVEVPSLEKQMQKLESEKSSLVTRLETQDSLVRDAATIKDDGDSLSKTVSSIAQFCAEIARYEHDISRLSSQQKLSGSSLTTDEIDQQSTACEEKIRAVSARITKIGSDKEQAISVINLLDKEEADLNQKVSSAKNQLETKNRLSAEIQEYRDSSNQLYDSNKIADQELESLAPEVSKAKAQYEEVQKRGRAQEKQVQSEKDDVAKTVHKFKVAEDSINNYIETDGPGKLATCERSIRNIEQEQMTLDVELAQVTKSANEMKERVADSESTRKSIMENLRYRKNLKQLKNLQDEISELKSRNVVEDHEQLEEDALSAAKYYQNLYADRGPIVGELKAKDGELSRYLQEWETDYKTAAEDYRETHLKVEVVKAACDDLAKYGSALDAAIMKYHSMKMEEINQIAGELWQRTYQGTDIDAIMIRSENEDGSKTTSTSRRSYNYRVVMVKGDVEMDMRGRCSAGQKVLASIIIRLALAECFGINCGVIALDEPTTNLDADNIKALATSLHAIITARRHQSNFQLIIITHDEEFLKEMNCADFAEHFWQVSRDREQKSKIERAPITDLMQ